MNHGERMARKALEFIARRISGKPQTFIEAGVGHRGAVSYHVPRFEPWAGVQILGCEPDAQRHATCRVNYPGRLLHTGFWSGSGVSTLYTDGGHYASVFPQDAMPHSKIALMTLDELEARIGSFGEVVLWADIEGSELEMLRGADKLLRSGRVLGLMLEVRNGVPAAGWCTKTQVEEFLRKYGYARGHKFRSYNSTPKHWDVLYTR